MPSTMRAVTSRVGTPSRTPVGSQRKPGKTIATGCSNSVGGNEAAEPIRALHHLLDTLSNDQEADVGFPRGSNRSQDVTGEQ